MADQELLVKFKGDDSDLARTFARVGKMMDMYPNQANKAARAAKTFESSNRSLSSTFNDLAGGYISLSAAIQGGKMFLDAVSGAQKYENQLKVASGTQADFAKNTAFLEGLSDKYNKNILELGKSYAQLTIATRGTSIEGEKADRLFAAVTATSSALQMSVEDTNGTFNAFIQMISKGNVQAEELRGQLGERLYGAFNLAAKAMGKSTTELNGMLERGEVLASDLLPKLTVELEKSFGDIAQKNAHNLGSEIEYIAGQVTLLVSEASKSSGITDFLTDAAGNAGDLVKELRNANKEFGLLGSVEYTAEKGAAAYVNLLIAGLEKVTNLLPGIQVELGRIDGPENKLNGFNEYVKNQGMTPSMPNFPIKGEIKGPKPYIGPGKKSGGEKTELTAAQKRAIEKELKAWTADQIQQSKNRTAAAIFDIESGLARDTRGYNSWLPTQQYQNSLGTKNTYSTNGGDMSKTGSQFSNELGGGATAYKSLTQNLNEMTRAYLASEAAQRKATAATREANAANAEMSLSIESVTNGIEDMLRGQYGSMAAAAEKGWADLIAKVKSGVMSYEQAIKEFEKVSAGIQAGDMMEQAAKQYATGLVQFAGQMGAALSGIGEDSATVGDRLFSITANLMDQLGQALVVASGIFEAFELGIASMNPAVALVGAALAFGAASILRAQAQDNASSAFWTGGIVGGRGGVDQVQASVTKGEMIVNGSQQNRLWGIISGANSHRDLAGVSGGNAMGGEITVYVKGGIKGSDIDFAGKQGNRINNYHRVKRG